MKNNENISVAVPIINYRLQIAERLGANKSRILQKSGIDPALLMDTSSRISLQQERTLWQIMIQETGREDMGLVCGLNFPIQSTGLIGYMMMNSPSIGIAMKKICVYQKMIGNSMGMRVEEDDHYFTIFIDLWSTWYEELRYTLDIMLSACLSWSEKITVKPIRPIRVGIHYEQPSNEADYRKAFGPVPVEFGATNSYLVYNTSDMNLPLLTQDSTLFEFFEKQVKEQYHEFKGTHTVARKTKKLILGSIEGDTPGIENIASELSMSIRSLQKALKAENTTYQHLLHEARKELAIGYLKKGVFNKSEIAYLLGFSELAVFSRTFKKWTGFSPSEYPF